MPSQRHHTHAVVVILLSGICLSPRAAAAAEKPTGLPPTGLMCELLAMPERCRLADATPEFSWIVNSAHADDAQTAYQIRVASSFERLLQGKGDVWDSGKVDSKRSVCVSYAGPPLKPHRSYHWQVRVWTEHGGVSPYSTSQQFNTGELTTDHATARYPLVKEEIPPVRIVKTGPGKAFVDFGRAAFGTVKLILETDKPDAKLTVHLGEVLADDATINRKPGGHRRYRQMNVPLREGTHTYVVEIPKDLINTRPAAIKMPRGVGEVMPFRYCELEGLPHGLEPAQIRQVVVHYPFNEEASCFVSTDSILNAVWDLCKYSIKATSFTGVYVDGDRERIPYEADAYINQLGHYCVDREFSMARYTHEYLIDHPTWPTEWIIHSVLMAWDDYLHTGDPASLAAYYDDLQAKTLIALARADGLISTTTGLLTKEVLESIHFKGKLRDIVDWPHGSQGGVNAKSGETDAYEFTDINTVVNAFHCRALDLMVKIAKVLDKHDDARRYAADAQRARRSLNAKLFDAERGVYVDGEDTKHASLHANMFPLAFKLVPPERVKSVSDFVISRGMVCSVYGSQHLLDALYEAERGQAALDLMTNTTDRGWFNMIRVGSTITLEAWDDKYKPNQDWNHAWGAAPANVIPRRLVGVTPLAPGFAKARIKPQVGDLTAVRATVPTIRGPIRVMVRQQSGESYRLRVCVPANVEPVVHVPSLGGTTAVVVDGKRREVARDQAFLRIDDVGPGVHTFEVRAKE